MKRAIWISFAAAMLLVQFGCRNSCGRGSWCGGTTSAPAPIFVPPPPPTPTPMLPPAGVQQSGGFPTLPPGALVNPPPGAKIQQPGQPPSISNSPPGGSGSPPVKESSEPPANRNVPPGIRLYAPESLEKEEPPAKQQPKAQATLPPIGQFAVAKDNVYAGLRPGLDGLDWLRDNRVATVVQILLPGEDDSSDRKQVEDRGMRYVGFEISPQTLTKDKVDAFVKLIRDGARQGIFVYDQNGSLAGAMWYLYLRDGEFLDDDASQLRARQLGLNLNRDDQHRDMWLAVQKILSSR